jgi:hypothetical protein
MMIATDRTLLDDMPISRRSRELIVCLSNCNAFLQVQVSRDLQFFDAGNLNNGRRAARGRRPMKRLFAIVLFFTCCVATELAHRFACSLIQPQVARVRRRRA